MSEEKLILDVESYEKLNSKLKVNFSILHDRLLAVAMDYGFYIDDLVNNKELYARRNNVIYRLDCLAMQLDWLNRQILENDQKSNAILLRSSAQAFNVPFSPFDDLKISALFDNIIFNAVSLFDYLSSLVIYTCTNQKDKRSDWTSLSKSAQDKNNGLFGSMISSAIIEVNRDLVGKLYDHRSFVIHTSSDHGSSKFSISFTTAGQKGKNTYYLSQRFIKTFFELKELNKSYRISLMYGAFWLVNKCINSVDKILLSLKKFMEENPLVTKPNAFLKQKADSDEKLPMSQLYWNLNRNYDFTLNAE